MKYFKKILSLIVVLSLIVPGISFADNLGIEAKSTEVKTMQTDEIDKDKSNQDNKIIKDDNKFVKKDIEQLTGEQKEQIVESIKNKSEEKKSNIDLDSIFKDDDKVRIIVELEEKPTIFNAIKNGVKYSNLENYERNKLENNLCRQQQSVKQDIKSKGIKYEDNRRSFTTVFNGFSGEVEYKDIPSIEKMNSVKKVYICNEYKIPEEHIEMNWSGETVGTNPIWNIGYKGEGMVVAVIDSGIDYEHKDMILSEETVPKLTEQDVNNIIDTQKLRGKYYTEKIPYGYNYFDEDEIIKDSGDNRSEHGMHVSGIVGANGNIEEGGVKGVAPECQILGMKVFSNDPLYSSTFDDITLQAIDDAVKLGADALNMSLGSVSASYEADNAMNKAIENAVKNGVVCCMAGGNVGHMTSGWSEYDGLPFKENPDLGVVDRPGCYPSTIQAASIDNLKTGIRYLSCKVKISEEDVLPVECAIVEDKAYGFNYLNENVDAQKHLVDARKEGEEVYLKLNSNQIVDLYGKPINDYSNIPEKVTYFKQGEEPKEYSIIVSDDIENEEKIVKIPMVIPSKFIYPSHEIEGEVEFVDCGLGRAEDFEGKEVKGKVALMMRGENSFVQKIKNAENAEAAGALIYNHEEGGEEFIGMVINEQINIPSAFITHSSGKLLLSLENKKISFPDDFMISPNPTAGEMSSFTSWGVNSNLEFKPEITAPGGSIFSTLQDNAYGIMSGTSMSSPHVAGGSALVMQYINSNDKYKDLTEEEKARLVKIFLMNTADIIQDKTNNNVPYSPRRQGAGLMNLYGAVSTPTRLVNNENGKPKIELKDFDNKNFDINLKAINDSDNDITYKVEVQTLMDIINEEGLDTLKSKQMDVILDAPETITVPANDSKEFSISVDISTESDLYRNMFVEGFVTLRDTTDTYPTLNIPYVGFYGDWNEPPILDGMQCLGEKSYYKIAGMVNLDIDSGSLYNFMTDKIAISPGTECGQMFETNNALPVLSFMRNADDVQMRILDEDGNKLRTLCMLGSIRKSYCDEGYGPIYYINEREIWNGKINEEVAKDGLYYYQIICKPQYEGSTYQEKKIPVYVDTKAPLVEEIIYDEETGKISWKASDETSGLYAFEVFVNNESKGLINAEEGKNEYECSIPKISKNEKSPEILISAYDCAMNTGVYSTRVELKEPCIYVTAPLSNNIYDENKILVQGSVVYLEFEPTVKINGELVEVNYKEDAQIPEGADVPKYKGSAYEFSKILTLKDGYQKVKIEAIAQGGKCMSQTKHIFVDTISPKILDIEVLEREPDSSTADLKITVKENFPQLYVYVNDSQVGMIDEFDTFNNIQPIQETIIAKDIPLKVGKNKLCVKLVDVLDHTTTEIIKIFRKKPNKNEEDETLEDIKEDETSVENEESETSEEGKEDETLVDNEESETSEDGEEDGTPVDNEESETSEDGKEDKTPIENADLQDEEPEED